MNQEEKLLQIFAEVLDVEIDNISLETTRDDLEEWDSLAMVELVGEIEDKFSCNIPFDYIDDCKKIKDFIKYL